MWTDEHKAALKSLMDGNEDEACRRWTLCIKMAEESQAEPSFELGEAYHYLGKTLMDCKRDGEAVPYLEKATELIELVKPDDQRLRLARQHLDYALRNSGNEEKADALHDEYSRKKKLKEIREYQGPPLKKALKDLQKCGIGMELTAEELDKICGRLNLDPNARNYFIDKVLLAYYQDGPPERLLNEKCFISDYKDYDIREAVAKLAALASKEGKIELDEVEKTDVDWTVNLSLKLNGEELFWDQISNIDAVVNLFNQILESLDTGKMFLQMAMTDAQSETCVYFFLKDSQLYKLRSKDILHFWD
jgi:hypothetical protein